MLQLKQFYKKLLLKARMHFNMELEQCNFQDALRGSERIYRGAKQGAPLGKAAGPRPFTTNCV